MRQIALMSALSDGMNVIRLTGYLLVNGVAACKNLMTFWYMFAKNKAKKSIPFQSLVRQFFVNWLCNCITLTGSWPFQKETVMKNEHSKKRKNVFLFR